jgi:hypothetical protein
MGRIAETPSCWALSKNVSKQFSEIDQGIERGTGKI